MDCEMPIMDGFEASKKIKKLIYKDQHKRKKKINNRNNRVLIIKKKRLILKNRS